jgi:tetratricopeptide (TPR) repeat protein
MFGINRVVCQSGQKVSPFASLYLFRIQRKGNAMFSVQSCRFQVFALVILFAGTLTAFAEDPNIPQEVLDLQEAAKQCMDKKDYACAKEKYQQVLRIYPGDIWSQYGLVKVAILTKDSGTAESEIAKLFSDYSDHPQIARAVCHVADDYFRTRNYAEAKQLYQTAITKWPDSPERAGLQHGLARSLIRLGDISGSKTATETLLSACSDHPQTAEGVRRIAYEYFKTNHYAEAKQLYQTAITNWPDSPQRVWLQDGLARSLIQLGDISGSKTATETLLSECSDQPQTAARVRRIADDYFNANHYAETEQLCRRAITNWPDSAHRVWLQHRLARSLIQLGDISGSKTATETLLSECSDHPQIAERVYTVASEYLKTRNFAEAKQLCQVVINSWPDSLYALTSRAILVGIMIQQGDVTTAEQAYQSLLTDYAGHQGLSKAIFLIGEYGYYDAAVRQGDPEQARVDLQKSVELINTALELMSDGDTNAGTYYYVLGLNYQKLEDYDKAARAFADSYQSNPKFNYADYCLFAQGYCTDKLMEQELVSEADAKTIITMQYQQLVSEFPNSDYAKDAQEWLDANL